jgi:diguanylate cyclase (GGDEF)-like protein
MARNLIEELKEVDRLPSAPEVAMEIVRLNQQDDVSVGELSEVLSRDPALVAKVLKTANSSMFGLPREITSVRQAIMILGFRSVNLLALSFSLVSTSSRKTPLPFDYRRYWTSTIATTVASRFIADLYAPVVKEEAFVGGLLCDLGQLLLVECAPEHYGPVLAAMDNSDRPLDEVEQELLGTTHMELAEKLLDSWGLPLVLCEAIGAHHDPGRIADPTSRPSTLARVLHLSTLCSELLLSDEADLEAAVEGLRDLGNQYFHMDGVACSELLKAVESRFPDTAKMLDVEMEDPQTLLEVRTRASELLVRESLALNEQVQSVSHEVELLSEQKRELEVQALTDALTGLGNRAFFDETLRGEIDRARQQRCGLGLLILDMDHFKSVNDTYGHSAGDELLRSVARVVRDQIREADSAARWGGEELAVICPAVSRAELERCAEKLRAAIEAIELTHESGVLRRTVSIGGCVMDEISEGDGNQKLIEAADRELYRAKSEGRNRVCVTVGTDKR